MNNQKGFTLIELMIVCAIIGIIAAIALPQYEDYVSKSRVAAGVKEVASVISYAETKILNNEDYANATEIGMPKANICSPFQASYNTSQNGATQISCTLQGNPKINGVIIEWNRTSDARWACNLNTTAVGNIYPSIATPKGCTVNGA